MNKFLLYFVFTISSSLNLYSQSPGFMGKRLAISYGFHASPAIIGATKNNETLIGDIANGPGSAETGVIKFNNLHEISLDFVATSKWLICLNVKYYKTAFDNSQICEARNINSGIYFTDRPKGFYNIRGISYGIIFKYFGNRYIAPWGRYVMFGPVINTVKTTYDEKMFINTDGNPTNTPTINSITYFGPKNQNFSGFNFLFGWGKSRIIANKIIVDFGASTQLFSLFSIPLYLLDIDISRLGGKGYPTNDLYIEKTYRKRVLGINRFNIFLKIGYLF